MTKKHIVIIGAGPGGLTAGMILAKRGYKVSIFEKEAFVGGRNAPISINGYTFDTEPTFLMMTFILREMFAEAGRKLEDYCTLVPLDPMYKLSFSDFDIFPTSDREKIITSADWQNERSLFLGATFNLGHTLTQMLYLRPRNKFEEVNHCYLVGGGTHPGSGLPTIYESARITANLIEKYER